MSITSQVFSFNRPPGITGRSNRSGNDWAIKRAAHASDPMQPLRPPRCTQQARTPRFCPEWKTGFFGGRHPLVCLSRRNKYCDNGGKALAHQHRSGWLGVQEGDHGPFQRRPEDGCFAGETAAGSGARALWGSNGLVCLLRGGEVLPRRGHGLRPPVKRPSSPTAGAQMGAIIEVMAPIAAP
jgi:hypothetical protein